MGSWTEHRFEVRWINGEEIHLHNRGYCQRIHENMDNTWVISAVADVVDALMTMLDWLNNPTFGTQMISAGEMTIDYKTFSQW